MESKESRISKQRPVKKLSWKLMQNMMIDEHGLSDIDYG